MTHALRDQRPGFHHIRTRGNNKRATFGTDDDRLVFLSMLERVARRYGWRIYAYALMNNHYHLVLEIDERGMSTGMCELNTAYATYFNGTHGRINHLFGRRYWSDPLVDDTYLLNAIRYVVQNPRRSGQEGPLELHEWTSYAATVGVRPPQVTLARAELLELFSPRPDEAVRLFRDFCETYVPPRPVLRQPPSTGRAQSAT